MSSGKVGIPCPYTVTISISRGEMCAIRKENVRCGTSYALNSKPWDGCWIQMGTGCPWGNAAEIDRDGGPEGFDRPKRSEKGQRAEKGTQLVSAVE